MDQRVGRRYSISSEHQALSLDESEYYMQRPNSMQLMSSVEAVQEKPVNQPGPYKLQKHFSEIHLQTNKQEGGNRIMIIEGRRLSLPEQSKQSQRKFINQLILLQILELGMDLNLAQAILQTLPEEEFTEDNQTHLLQRVVERVWEADVQIYTNNENIADQTVRTQTPMQLTMRQRFWSIIGYARDQEEQKTTEGDHTKILIEEIDCAICMCGYPKNDSFKMEQCEHLFCRDCILQYFKNQIMSSEVLNMRCPDYNCGQRISDQAIKQYISEELFNKMMKFRRIKFISEDPNMKFCPRAGCELVVKRLNNEKVLQCECGQRICFKCGNPAHGRQSCESALDSTFKHAISEYMIQKCPKCSSPIQKSDGCNHMTCQHCRHEFCWLCRGKYNYKHYEAYNICGCPGLQFSDFTPFKCPILYRFLVVIAFLGLGPPALVLGLVLGAVGLIFGLPALIYCNSSCYRGNCCEIIVLFIFCIVLAPLSLAAIILGIALGAVLIIPYGIWAMIDWCRYR